MTKIMKTMAKLTADNFAPLRNTIPCMRDTLFACTAERKVAIDWRLLALTVLIYVTDC